MQVLLNADDRAPKRQFALVDKNGGTAAYTGADLDSWNGWSGSAAGEGCVAVGNGLAGSDVVHEMVGTFQQPSGTTARGTFDDGAGGR